MASQVEIANVSLGLCGSARINAVTEDSKGAQYVNQFWALARQKDGWFVGFALLALACKEDMALVVAMTAPPRRRT